ADAGLAGRLDRAQQGLALARALDGVRLEAATLVEGRGKDPGAVAGEDAAAFRSHGLDVSGGERGAGLAGVKGTGVPRRAGGARGVGEAVGGWASTERGPARRRLLTLARGVDPDPLRDRLRDPALWESPARLRRLARRADLSGLPPALLTAVAARVEAAG